MGLTDGIWYGNDMSEATRNAFFWLAAAISIPATLYGSQPFFRSAWNSVRQRRTNMDVPISLAIVLSLSLSLYETIVHGAQTYFDAAVMLTFLLLIGRYLDFHLRDRARGAARQLLVMQSALVHRDRRKRKSRNGRRARRRQGRPYRAVERRTRARGRHNRGHGTKSTCRW